MTSKLPSTETKPQPRSILVSVATRFQMEPEAFERTLRGTVFPHNGTREQFAAFLVVADRYKLDPITKQIYAFPAKGGGIVPVVGIDGWIHLVNSHAQMNGMEFTFEHTEDGTLISCTCRIHRKDRSMPTVITEYLDECIRNTDPWKMKRRMLRHKALIQCARVAFGFSGIHDEDEARDIAESVNGVPPEPAPPPPPDAVAQRDAGTVEEAEIVEPARNGVGAAQAQMDQPNGEAQTETFLYADWLAHVREEFATCQTESDVDEAHEGFKDVVEERLTRAQGEEYAELHEAALTRVTDGERSAAAEAQQDDEEAPADPAPPSPTQLADPQASRPGAPMLDDEEEETREATPAEMLHAENAEFLAQPGLTKEMINLRLNDTLPKRKALKAAGQWTDEDKARMEKDLGGAWNAIDEAELAAGKSEGETKPEETEADAKIRAFTEEFNRKMDEAGSVTEMNAYFASTLTTRNGFGLDTKDPRVQAWKQKKIDRTAALNG